MLIYDYKTQCKREVCKSCEPKLIGLTHYQRATVELNGASNIYNIFTRYLHYCADADALILVGIPRAHALIRLGRQRTGVIGIVRADAGRTGRFRWVLAYVESFVAYVYNEDIPWRWDVEMKSKTLIIGQNHLIMGQVNLYICIGHVSFCSPLVMSIQHTAQ